MSTLQIGSIIKSYDFNGVKDCYMMGEVTSIKGNLITCTTLKRVYVGVSHEVSDVNSEFHTVTQGSHFMDSSETPRIEIVG